MFRPGVKRPRPLLPSRALSNAENRAILEQSAEKSPSTARGSQKTLPLLKRPRAHHAATVKSRGGSCGRPESQKLCFGAMYTKRSSKKFKTYMDGFLILRDDRFVSLLNEEGKEIAKSSSSKGFGGLTEGNTLEMNSFAVEVMGILPQEDFESGRIFLAGNCDSATTARNGTSASSIPAKSSSLASKQKFRAPLRKNGSGLQTIDKPVATKLPAHDPSAPGALIIQQSYLHPSGTKTVPIVLDPFLNRHMRPHQKEGVRFLYDCIEGKAKNTDENRGAVLADEMGLGKSLQSIALIWTVLKQGPLGPPVAKKAIIVCPASLVGNWISEVNKWLGSERITPISVQPGAKSYTVQQSLADFVHGNIHRLLVISYEAFRNYADVLYKSNCGILVCDEGHRLKAALGNKTIDALAHMPCRRRVILTGTPVQNDLDEFFSMCNFVNPGALGTLSTFRTIFSIPIASSRDANASSEVSRIGEARAQELGRISSKFVLRRTSETIEKFLPPKTETAIFCRLRDEQERLYKSECSTGASQLRSSGSMGAAFCTINRLRKICCHPAMHADYNVEHENVPAFDFDIDECSSLDPSKIDVMDSAKLQVAVSIITASVTSGDRILVVSNFTVTLDIVQEVLNHRGFTYMRLDGSTPVRLRTDLVKTFNSATCSSGIFLLSAKAGGVGLNLIGANRLILFDPDWNPATDLQAMARVWRDGQQKDVFVYRLLSTGTIEEKIYQRQMFKGELQHALGGTKKNGMVHMQDTRPRKVNDFSADDLKDLFTYRADEMRYCDTLEILERCQQETRDRIGASEDDVVSRSNLLSSFQRYRHCQEHLPTRIDIENVTNVTRFVHDDVLDHALNRDNDARGIVSYLYTKSTTDRPQREFDETMKQDSHPNESVNVGASRNKGLAATDPLTPATPSGSESSRPFKRNRLNENIQNYLTAESREDSGKSDLESCDDSLSDADILRPLSSRLDTSDIPKFVGSQPRGSSKRPLIPESDSEGPNKETGSIACEDINENSSPSIGRDQSEAVCADADTFTWNKVVDDLTLEF